MLDHYRQRGDEPLCLNLQSGMVWNYMSDKEVLSTADSEPLQGTAEAAMFEVAGEADELLGELRRAVVAVKRKRSRRDGAASGRRGAGKDDPTTPVAEDGVASTRSSRDRSPAEYPVSLERAQEEPAPPEGGGLAGLENLGNTCFLNSGLQALGQVPYFSRLLTEVPYSSPRAGSPSRPDMAIALQWFLRDQWHGPHPVLTPQDVLFHLRRVNRMFTGFHQHDAQEALRFLLSDTHERLCVDVPLWVDQHTDLLDETLALLDKGPPPAPDPSTPSTPLGPRGAGSGEGPLPGVRMERAESVSGGLAHTAAAWEQRAWLHDGPFIARPTVERSPIADAFQGLLCSRVRCRECQLESRTFARFFDLSLSIPAEPHNYADNTGRAAPGATPLDDSRARGFGSGRRHGRSLMWSILCSFNRMFDRGISLDDCLYNFCDSDALVGTDQYFCERCRRRVDADKTIAVAELPDVLCLHLKRFATTGGWAGKIGTHVNFPIRGLNLEPFVLRDTVQAAREIVRQRQVQLRRARTAAETMAGADPPNATGEHSHPFPALVVRGDAPPPILSDTPYSDSIAEHVVAAAESARVLRDRVRRPPVGGPGEGPFLYDLVAVVEHMGAMGGGHYVAYGKHRGANHWMCFNDTRVHQVSERTVASKQAYLLFYVRRAPEPPSIPRPPPGSNQRDIFCFVSRAWWIRRQLCASPGPITHLDVACDHGRLRQNLCGRDAWQHVVPVTWDQWSAMVRLYGVQGQPLRSLEPCPDCEREAEALRERRAREYQQVVAVDSFQVNRSEGDMAGVWYIVSAKWLKRWNEFIDNQGTTDGTGRGILPPGPVDNSDLLRANGNPRPNLRPVQHYRGVNAHVWRFFMDVYGGGPMLRRRELDIYDPPLDPIPVELLGVLPDDPEAASPTAGGAGGAGGAARAGAGAEESSAVAVAASSPSERPEEDEDPDTPSVENPLSQLRKGSPGGKDDE